MRLSTLCFAAGVFCLQQFEFLPESDLLFASAMLGCLLLLLPLLHSRLRIAAPIGAFLLGLAWAGGMAQHRLADSIAEADEGRDIRIVGQVLEMPQRFENGIRFAFHVEQAEAVVPQKISLAWYRGWRRHVDERVEDEFHAAPQVHAGERWQLTVRLKRPHGNLNPEGFDFEAWLLENNLRATGYVRPAEDNRRLAALVVTPKSLIEHFREDIRARFERQLPESAYVGILTALAVGDQHSIDNAQWQLFSRTGITHLMSISGLHVTMFASLAYLIVSGAWRRSARLMLFMPAQRAAVIGGFLAALGYCLIAGFAVPAQRTLYMLGVVAFALWRQRSVAASHVLALALLLVLLFDPWAVLAPGFWLSFGAVGILFYIGSARLGAHHWLLEWGRAQWAVTLGMIPLLLLLFQQFSLVSPLANAVAIPVVSFLVTPLVLAAALLPPLGFLLEPAHWLTSWLMDFIGWLASWPWAIWQQHAPPTWAWLSGLLGCLWLLLPRGMPARWLGLLALLPMLALPPVRPAPGAAIVRVLDVGQGLAIHVQTAGHDLLYDTGPMFSPAANSGNRIILPYLRAQGVERLDGMVVTHQDTDHSGGAEAVLDGVTVGWFMNSLPHAHRLSAMPVPALRCAEGQAWEWDGVHFELLHPLQPQYLEAPRKSNDMSCVLRISTPQGSVLLTSDIEALSERALLERYAGPRRAMLRADVMIAPHHGSRTSSTAEFIAAVGARTVVFPVGYRNHFGHPRADVVQRYRNSGAQLYRTDRDGAISLMFEPAGLEILTERSQRRRYWHGR